MDKTKLNAFAERLDREKNAALSLLNVYLGLRLGLFENLADAGAATARELAERTGCVERYVREWLACMYAGEYLDYDAETEKFSLAPEYAMVLLDRNQPTYGASTIYALPHVAGILPLLQDAFRNGGGVPFAAYGDGFRESAGGSNRPMFLNDYASKWIPALPDVEKKLRAGARVAEIGCGEGWAAIALAKSFPNARVEAVDSDAASIAQAEHNARQEGVADRVAFHLASVENRLLRGAYDFVTAFECLHDMAYPVNALKAMRELALPDGVVLIADEAVSDRLEENRNFLGQYCYNWSVLHCLPQALVYPNAAGTGTVMGPAQLTQYAQAAGFSRIDILPIENPVWRFYRLTP